MSQRDQIKPLWAILDEGLYPWLDHWSRFMLRKIRNRVGERDRFDTLSARLRVLERYWFVINGAGGGPSGHELSLLLHQMARVTRILAQTVEYLSSLEGNVDVTEVRRRMLAFMEKEPVSDVLRQCLLYHIPNAILRNPRLQLKVRPSTRDERPYAVICGSVRKSSCTESEVDKFREPNSLVDYHIFIEDTVTARIKILGEWDLFQTGFRRPYLILRFLAQHVGEEVSFQEIYEGAIKGTYRGTIPMNIGKEVGHYIDYIVNRIIERMKRVQPVILERIDVTKWFVRSRYSHIVVSKKLKCCVITWAD